MSTITTAEVIPAGAWTVDPVHTTVTFQVADTGELVSIVNGRFSEVEGTIEGGGRPSFAGTVRVASLRTDNEQRDAHLTSPDFLDASRHPEIHFASKTVEPLDGDRFVVRGDLIVKEIPFEVELEGRVRGTGQGKAGDERLLVEAHGAFDWGTTSVEVTAAVSATKEA